MAKKVQPKLKRPVLDDNTKAWSVYLENRDVFSSALKLTGEWKIDEGLDLIHDFLIERLPSALNSFDPQKGKMKNWLFTVFFRYAKRRKLEIHSLSKRWVDFDLVGELANSSMPIDESQLKSQREEVFKALGKLDDNYQTILITFFGDSSNANNLRAISRKYGISRHRAEKMVLEGLAMLSAQLNEPGILSKEEMDICKYFLLEGKNWPRISELTEKTEFQARSSFKKALAKFKSCLI